VFVNKVVCVEVIKTERTSALMRLGTVVQVRGSWPWRAMRRGRGVTGTARGRGYGYTMRPQYVDQQSYTRGRWVGWRGRGNYMRVTGVQDMSYFRGDTSLFIISINYFCYN